MLHREPGVSAQYVSVAFMVTCSLFPTCHSRVLGIIGFFLVKETGFPESHSGPLGLVVTLSLWLLSLPLSFHLGFSKSLSLRFSIIIEDVFAQGSHSPSVDGSSALSWCM